MLIHGIINLSTGRLNVKINDWVWINWISFYSLLVIKQRSEAWPNTNCLHCKFTHYKFMISLWHCPQHNYLWIISSIWHSREIFENYYKQVSKNILRSIISSSCIASRFFTCITVLFNTGTWPFSTKAVPSCLNLLHSPIVWNRWIIYVLPCLY